MSTHAMETAWAHVPALRYTGYTSGEYLRLQYELKYQEIPPTCVVELLGVNDRENPDAWFAVRIQMDKHDDLYIKPEEAVLWLPHCVLHVIPNGNMFAYFRNGRMLNITTEDLIKTITDEVNS